MSPAPPDAPRPDDDAANDPRAVDGGAPQPAPADARPRVWPHALGAALLTLLGGASYLLMLDYPWARETGIPALAIMLVGVVWAGWALRRRVGVASVAGLAVSAALTLMFVASLYFVTLPPAGGAPAVGDRAPSFALPDQSGRTMALSDALARGPVLLVFYRGHW